jgi:drug/metabolite transporter (DMT)-like permease
LIVMLATTAVSTIAQTIQLSVAPVFLLAGIGAILNVMAGRLGRVVDRARMLEQLHPKSTGPEHDRHVWELRLLDRRIAVINAAIFVIVMSAIAVCLLVALLFVAELTHLEIGNAVAIVFVLSMALLILSLALFLFEIRLALRSIRIREELLERGARRTLR